MPPVGTWIEIPTVGYSGIGVDVVPPVGTWIEITFGNHRYPTNRSCPPWARGLKSYLTTANSVFVVVPPVGTWIEISISRFYPEENRRAPRGHVD